MKRMITALALAAALCLSLVPGAGAAFTAFPAPSKSRVPSRPSRASLCRRPWV